MDWSDLAHARAQAVLIANAKDLWAESERIAKRAEAESVSSAYVESASRAIRLRQPSTGLADICLVLGPLLVGLATGPALTFVADQWNYDRWVGYATVISGAAGLILTTLGSALKARRR